VVEYTYTVANLGDTKASNVTLDCSFATAHLAFSDGEGGDTEGVSERRFNLGSLNPGETREYTYQAIVGDTLPTGAITTIPLTVEVAATENEDVLENNSDTIAVEAGIVRQGGNSSGGGSTKKAAALDVTKEAAFPNTTVPALMDYTITIKNSGGPVYNAILSDFMRSEDGTLIHDEFWNLDTIASGETVTVTYSMEFASTTKSGVYTNSAQVTGNHRKVRPSASNVYQSAIATASITITNLLQPLLAAELLSCDPYLKTHMRMGYNNDSDEVVKLQVFLKEHMPSALSENGLYDTATEAAVRNFQERYRSEVLDPWGINSPTGYVYLTTKKLINEIVCRHEIAFPLTPEEEEVIAQSRLGN
jgi:peptidoglycan hydrolase-like protein with peptidoglycan-binding domain